MTTIKMIEAVVLELARVGTFIKPNNITRHRFSLCNLCVSVVSLANKHLTTEVQRTQSCTEKTIT